MDTIYSVLSPKLAFIEKYFATLNHPQYQAVEKLLLTSDYACKYYELVKKLLQHDDCSYLLSRQTYFTLLQKLSIDSTLVQYMSQLRQFRHTHFLRLLILQLANTATTEEIMRSWSDCADALISHAMMYCCHFYSERYGLPRDKEGNQVRLMTLAMGKLGGLELNFSSDIDLIFAFGASGATDGTESISNQQYFNKVAQHFIQIMQNITHEGFVFRVDLRLRPNGDSGALVTSLAAMETYYQEQGRDWERYAMVKARVVSEELTASHPWFTQLITPFIYRRYVDFSVIESLRSMKAMIEREVQLNPRLDDIKRGQGGIREIEFIIQNVQLIRGGRIPELRETNALAALASLKKHKLLDRSDALKQGYLFLRQLENVLQSLNDQQTHSLPTDPIKQAQVTLAMAYPNWDKLLEKLHQYQRIISHCFHNILGDVADYSDEKKVLANQLTSVWQGHIETEMAVNLLSSLGYQNAEHCYQMIHALRHGPRCRRLGQGGRLHLDRLMSLLLSLLPQFKNSDAVLLQVMRLLDNIMGRSAYLALLTENPAALQELLVWFAHSSYIGSLLVNYPFLLEVLLDQEQRWRPESQGQLKLLLAEK